MTDYFHEDHLFMRVKEPWAKGVHMVSANVVWPKVRPGDFIRCGTCGWRPTPDMLSDAAIRSAPCLPGALRIISEGGATMVTEERLNQELTGVRVELPDGLIVVVRGERLHWQWLDP